MERFSQTETIVKQRYRLVKVLGQGGCGVTYLAEDIKSDRQVALKALSLHRLTDWKQIELFEREAQVLAQLQHPAIPRYLEYFQVDTPQERTFYLAQELAPGKSLATLVQEGWRTTEAEVKQIAKQVLEILVYLHSLEPPVIHRDIKPENIIRREDGQIFLVDFGAVQNTYYSTLARGSTVVGTFGYMAPEQFRGRAVPATDLYGLGATLLFLLTHRSPTEFQTEELTNNFRSQVNVSSDFANWLEKMLEPDVEDRFASAQEALKVLCGQQKLASSINPSLPKSVLVGGSIIALVVVALLYLLYPHKWAILSRLELTPANVCEPKIMTRYLQQGGNPNAWHTSFAASSPLINCAVTRDDLELVSLLIEKGADVNLRYWSNEFPLYNVQSPEMARLLIENGADVNVKNRSQTTPLHTARSKEIASTLIKYGADIDAKNISGRTSLHKARQKEIVQLLINEGAEVNSKDEDGNTPLHVAWSLNIAQLLVDGGAEVNAKNNFGKTPLHIAVEKTDSIEQKEQVEWVKFLLSQGAILDVVDAQGRTPLELATEEGKDHLVEVIKNANPEQTER